MARHAASNAYYRIEPEFFARQAAMLAQARAGTLPDGAWRPPDAHLEACETAFRAVVDHEARNRWRDSNIERNALRALSRASTADYQDALIVRGGTRHEEAEEIRAARSFPVAVFRFDPSPALHSDLDAELRALYCHGTTLLKWCQQFPIDAPALESTTFVPIVSLEAMIDQWLLVGTETTPRLTTRLSPLQEMRSHWANRELRICFPAVPRPHPYFVTLSHWQHHERWRQVLRRHPGAAKITESLYDAAAHAEWPQVVRRFLPPLMEDIVDGPLPSDDAPTMWAFHVSTLRRTVDRMYRLAELDPPARGTNIFLHRALKTLGTDSPDRQIVHDELIATLHR